ncbi:MAG: preprotein translocase subunit SecA [Flavobacteriales bacterium]|nr:preprotein translocase subunit SecA [Flavobacteriales bacterium]MCB9449131.1 preprotein translocase subunit SecA [Flavobacteriales bacterium]
MLGSLTKALKGILGNKSDRDLKEVLPLVEKINAEYQKLSSLSNDQLRAKTTEFQSRIEKAVADDEQKLKDLRGKLQAKDNLDISSKEDIYQQIDQLEKSVKEKTRSTLDELLPEAFAVMKDTARRFKENPKVEVTATEMDRDLAATRSSIEISGDKAIYANSWIAAGNEITWDMLHYNVQLIGGIVLHQGKIAEMATGEGKTLVATLPVYLNALTGKGVHVVTVNDYLAKRDAEWMGLLFEFHGLRVDCIDKYKPNSPERRKAYKAHVTYGTNNEFGFDYLRDNMAHHPEDLVQPGHVYAIVDEVDSVLVDDARTPLIISGPIPRADKHEFHELKPRVEKLVSAQRNYVTTLLADAKKHLAEGGKENDKAGGMALLRSHRGLPKNKALIKFLSEPGVKAQLVSTENYYMQDQGKEMHKVDQELYFVIDERHNTIELTEKGIDLITAQGEDPSFYIMPDVGSEIAEIEKRGLPDGETSKLKNELMRDFTVKSERIHTLNQLLRAYTLFEKDVEYVIMDGKIKIVDEQTGRIMEGRRYSDGLHQAIEAKENVKVEAATQTYATITLQNYFRMYDKLAGMTGTAETEAGEFWEIYKLDVVVIPTNRPIQRKDMEDKVYKTKREKYNAVIEEIVELTNAGRPVLVGTTSVETSELLSRMLKIRNIKHSVLNAKLHQKEAEIVAQAGLAGQVTIATNMAGRGTDIKLGPGVKDAGGLAIVATERHDSRRVDRQLRGRSGRQGDPGSSQFFVSLEDNLMRLFGSERISRMMDRLGLEEGEVIQHSMITKSIERAQRKVEENNFGIRKRLLEYDDVMNSQREVIYKRRRHALFGERLSVDISNMVKDVCESLSEEYQGYSDYEGFKLELLRILQVDAGIDEEKFLASKPDELGDEIYQRSWEYYNEKGRQIGVAAFPVIKDVYENQSQTYENIVVPFTDGIKTLQIVANLKECYESQGAALVRAFEKGTVLALIDNEWKEHLREMDDLKSSVQNAVYEQKDPLLIYKFESFKLFKEMVDRVNREVVAFLFQGNLPVQEASQVQQAAPPRKAPEQLQESRPESVSTPASMPPPGMPEGPPMDNGSQPKAEPVRVEKKVGRNEPCPCGSGKKFKQCHGKGVAS